MLKNNLKEKITHKYFGIQKDGKKWVVWYIGDLNGRVQKQVNDGIM